MRLFTAIDIPPEIIATVAQLIERLRPSARIHWSPPDNLHVTTKFIGEWPAERLEELKGVLAGLPAPGPIGIAIRQVGFFPNPHSPRVFWAGIQAGPELASLAQATDRALAGLGIEPEKRAFSPHLTLARVREPVPLVQLRQAIAGLDTVDFGNFTASSFFLYQSQLRPGGSVYTKLSEFPLSK